MSWADELDPGKPAPARPARGPRKVAAKAATREQKYAAATLLGECAAVRETKEGERNNRLNAAALRVGHYVPHLISENDAEDDLYQAAREAGLTEKESKKTISSGLKAGMKEPQYPPEPTSNGNGNGVSNGHKGEDLQPSDADAPDAPPASTASKTDPTKQFVILSAEDIFAALSEPDYLIDQIIRRGSLTEIVSYGGSGKSWLAVEMAVAVASGRMWLGRFQTKGWGRVLILDWENGAYEERRRIQAVARARDIDPDDMPCIKLCSMPDIFMSDFGNFGRAIAELGKKQDLIIIDTLKAAMPGIDENDSNMRVGLDHLRRVGEATGCSFVVLVHGKKVTGSLSAIDPREQGRGSSAIYDAADAVFHVAYTPGQPLSVSQTKARMGRTVEPFQVTIADTENGGVLVEAIASSSTVTSVGAEFDEACDAVLAGVKANPGASLRLLSEKLRKRHTTVSAALEQLQRHGAVTNTGKGTAGRWFAVSAGGEIE